MSHLAVFSFLMPVSFNMFNKCVLKYVLISQFMYPRNNGHTSNLSVPCLENLNLPPLSK